RPAGVRSAILSEEPHHVVEAEAAVAPLADAIEGQLAAIPEPLHGIHVEVEHLGDFRRREHRPELVDGHGPHMVVAFLYAKMASAPEGWPGVECGSLMGGAYGSAGRVAKPYFGLVAGTTSRRPGAGRASQEALIGGREDRPRSRPWVASPSSRPTAGTSFPSFWH